MEKPSAKFFNKAHHRSVFNIQSICNIPSVIKHGILSYNLAQSIRHTSVAMPEVQNKRNDIIIPNGLSLHDYASTYFDPRNPMMYKRQSETETLCVLAISSEVLDFEGTIISDGNAASGFTRFFSPSDGIDRLDFVIIYDEWWNSDDPIEKAIKKRIKCAEILVPNSIPYNFIIGACVVNETARQNLISQGFEKEIKIAPKVFFRREG